MSLGTRHRLAIGSGLQPSGDVDSQTWAVGPGWYEARPLALSLAPKVVPIPQRQKRIPYQPGPSARVRQPMSSIGLKARSKNALVLCTPVDSWSKPIPGAFDDQNRPRSARLSRIGCSLGGIVYQPANNMLFEKLSVTGVLSFGPSGLSLPLRRLNVLIGPHGSGKSNLLEVLALFQAVSQRLAAPEDAAGGIQDWLWKPAGIPATGSAPAVITVTLHSPTGHPEDTVNHRLTIEANGGRIEPTAEAIAIGIRLYRDCSFGPGSKAHNQPRADERSDYLSEDFGNLSLVLGHRRYLAVKRRLEEEMARFYEEFVAYHVVPNEGRMQLFLEEEGGRQIPVGRLSDGTLRYFCLLAILLDPEPPPLVAIEEPQLGLHPDVLPRLAELLVEASERMQLV